VPVEGDTVVEQDGFSVFVAPEVAQALPDGTLDAKPVDGETKLVLER
jgi:Fe-S cluster assembly iron-binding protein IscA